MKRNRKNLLITFFTNILIVCGVLISPGCSGVGDLAIGAAGNIIGNLVVEEVKEQRKGKEEKKNGEKSP